MTCSQLLLESLYIVSNLVADFSEFADEVLQSDLLMELITHANHPDYKVKREAYYTICTLLYCAD